MSPGGFYPEAIIIYRGALTGTIAAEDDGTRLFFHLLGFLTEANEGVFEGTPEWLAGTLSMDVEVVRHALEVLQQPDPLSTSDAENGRRIVSLGPNRWKVVNHQHYQELARIHARRAYDRRYKREARAGQIKREDEAQEFLATERGVAPKPQPAQTPKPAPQPRPAPVPSVPVPLTPEEQERKRKAIAVLRGDVKPGAANNPPPVEPAVPATMPELGEATSIGDVLGKLIPAPRREGEGTLEDPETANAMAIKAKRVAFERVKFDLIPMLKEAAGIAQREAAGEEVHPQFKSDVRARIVALQEQHDSMYAELRAMGAVDITPVPDWRAAGGANDGQ
jgi:hypothetical protein